MRRVFLIATAGLVCAGAVRSGEAPPRLPESFSYTILVAGERAGGSKSRVTYANNEIVIESSAWLDQAEGALEMACRAEVDPKTFRPIRIEYQGVTPHSVVKGTADVAGDSLFTHHVVDDNSNNGSAVSSQGGVILIEDYVIAHQVLLSRSLAGLETGDVARFGLGFASTGALLDASAGFVGDILVESETQETVCRRLVVELVSGSPFTAYYDPKRGLPVYLAFPGSATEVFLDSFYGDAPVSLWRPGTGAESTHSH